MLLKIFLVSAAILGISQGGVSVGRHESKGGYSAGNPYVMGGDIVADRYYPSIVSIRYDGIHVCGGVIVNENWILTAAECVKNRQPSSLIAVSGSNFLDSGDVHLISEVKIHEEYNVADSWRNDIAVIRVQEPITFKWGTLPVKLPPKGKTVPTLTAGHIVGWGSTQPGGEFSNQLRMVALIVDDTNKCNNTYHKFNLNIYNTQFCDGGAYGISTCDGDMGGPNFVDNEVYGIVSWGHDPCGSPYFPTVYTKVSEYIDWIVGHTHQS